MVTGMPIALTPPFVATKGGLGAVGKRATEHCLINPRAMLVQPGL